MAALLAVHGLSTPGMLVGPNGLIAVTGAATLPVGGIVMALSALPQFASARAIPRVIALQVVARRRDRRAQHRRRARCRASCPACPPPKSAPAIALFAIGLVRLRRARRPRDEHVPAHAPRRRLRRRRRHRAARVRALRRARSSASSISAGGSATSSSSSASPSSARSLVFDLRRGRRSRALVGDLRAAEIVASEEAYLGARVRALMVRLADEGRLDRGAHAPRRRARGRDRRAARPLPHRACAASRSAACCTTSASSRSPTAILQKPGPLDDDEFARRQAASRARTRAAHRARRLRRRASRRLVLDHHERLDGTGYPRGLARRRPRSRDAHPRGLRRLRRARLAARLPPGVDARAGARAPARRGGRRRSTPAASPRSSACSSGRVAEQPARACARRLVAQPAA